jgi:hypothetical protein
MCLMCIRYLGVVQGSSEEPGVSVYVCFRRLRIVQGGHPGQDLALQHLQRGKEIEKLKECTLVLS